MKTILIADDHPVVAAGIKCLFEKYGVGDVIEVASDMIVCEQKLDELKPDVLVLDVGMPEGNSLARLPEWLEKIPHLHVLVFSNYVEPAVIRRAMDAGSSGFVCKDSPVNELIEGVQAVGKGEQYYCSMATELIKNSTDSNVEMLTPREQQVLELVVEGLPMKQIADRLGLSFETVHSYTKNLRAKLGVNNTAALVRKALMQRLV